MECPKCRNEIGKATYCGCGWKQTKTERSEGIENCAWIGDAHERCHYPGTIWRTPHGVGPGFCRFHVKEDCTAAYGAAVVIESRNYRPRTMAQRDHDAVFGERTGPRACQERTCSITTRALPGKDFCAVHQRQFEANPESVKRVGMAGGKRIGAYVNVHQREPGDDDEEVAA